MKLLRLILLLLFFAVFSKTTDASAPQTISDSTAQDASWVHAIVHNIEHPHDTVSAKYPKFIRKCIDIFNRADAFLNPYDTVYVKSSGKDWKATLSLDNWTDSYAMKFSDNVPIHMMSDVTTDIGVSLSYLIFSVGYSINLTKVMGHRIVARNRFVASFTTGRLAADIYYWDNDGGTIVRRIGEYNNGHTISEPFKGLRLHSLGGHIYYFHNNKRYSQGAAYSFSTIQRRSTGSLILGLNLSRQDVDINFEYLDDAMKEHLKSDRYNYTFDYNDYSFIIGYGYNACLGKHWLLNISALPSIGLKQSRSSSIEGRRSFLAVNVQGKMAVGYNVRNFFTGFYVNFDGHWYKNGAYSFFNSMENLTLQTGLRF